MFLKLAHSNLDIYTCSRELVLSCYRLTKKFPDSEKFALMQQFRRAAVSIHLNIAEGCSRKSLTERKRYYEIARGSTIEIDTILEIAFHLKYCSEVELQPTGNLVIRTFQMLSAMIDKKNGNIG